MNKKSAFSIRDLCRTCMSSVTREDGGSNTTKHQYIYEKPADSDEDGPTIMKILSLVQPKLNVQLDDDLPKRMCYQCIQQIQIAHNFLKMYEEVNEKFLLLLEDDPPAESEQFQDTLGFVGAEKKGEDEEHFPYSGTQIEEIPVDLSNDSLEDVDPGDLPHLPEFEDAPVNDLAFEDDEESDFRSNRYSDASDSDWTNMNTKSKKETLKKKALNKSKSVLKSRIRQRTIPKTSKCVKENKELPPANKDGSISCRECQTLCANYTLWQEHMQEKHRKTKNKGGRPKKSYKCEYCGKVFANITAYQNHIRTHTGEEPYLCMECGKSFKVASTLNTHMLRHRGDLKFQCTQCPRKFVCHSGLYCHMMVHSKKKPYVCDICGKAFHMAYMLKKHNLYHNGIKNYPCEYCDQRFVTSEKQRRHMRTHTGEKPYVCKYCNRGFAQSNDCNKHLRQHLGDNIYQCELCPQRFPLARDLRAHFAIHKDDDEATRARNLKDRDADEKNLKIKLGIKEV